MAVSKYQVKVLDKRELIKDYWLVTFERPEGFEYEAGQYVSLKVNEDGLRRSYSLASFPSVVDRLELLIDVSPMGIGSQFILSLSVGDLVEILGPIGLFTVKNTDLESGKELIFVATGSGIVPVRSMINQMLKNGYSGKVILHWGMRYEGVFWGDEFENLKLKHSNFEYDLVISKPSDTWPKCKGHVTDCLEKYENLDSSLFYLCGSQPMINDVCKLLTDKGVLRESIFFEKFY